MTPRRIAELVDTHNTVSPLEKAVLAMLAMASSYYTWLGVAAIESSSDWFHKAGATIFAVAMGAGLYFFWRAALALVPLLRKGRQFAGLVVVLLGAVMVVGISSFFNLTGMIGGQALDRYLRSEVEQYSVAVTDANKSAQRGLEGIDILELNARKFKSLWLDERKGVGPSQTARDGAVSGMLAQVARTFETADGEAQQLKAQTNTLASQAQQILTTMETTIDSTAPVAAKIQPFKSEAQQLRLVLENLANVDVAPLIRDAVAAARQSVAPALASDRNVQGLQARAIQDINAKLGELETAATASLNGRSEGAASLPGPVNEPTVYDAVLDHALDYVPALLAAIFVDLLPAVALAFNILLARQRSVLEEAAGPTALYSIADLLAVREILVQLDTRSPDNSRPTANNSTHLNGSGVRIPNDDPADRRAA